MQRIPMQMGPELSEQRAVGAYDDLSWSPHRILVIDDTPAIHRDFRKVFGTLSGDAVLAAAEASLFGAAEPAPPAHPLFQIDHALQGELGLALVQEAHAQRQPYALAFIDVRMVPGWDGIETAARISAFDPDMQIVICTAHSDYTWAQVIEKLGQSDRWVVLKKPFDNIEVLQLACALGEKWRLARQARRHVEDLERLVAERTAALARSLQQTRQQAADLRQSEERYRSLFEHHPHPMWVCDARTSAFTAVNDAALEHYGYTRDEFLGMALHELQAPEDPAASLIPAGPGAPPETSTWRHRKKDGGVIHVEVVSRELTFAARNGRLMLVTDVTPRVRMESRLQRLMQHDVLTDLMNHAVFRDRLAAAMTRADRLRQPVGVMLLRFDRLGALNELLGAAAGDRVLIQMAERLKQSIGADHVAARLSGAEFAVTLDGLRDKEAATSVAQRALEALSMPVSVGGRDLKVPPSVGIALYPSDAADVDQLLRCAKTALRYACDAGDAGDESYLFYSAELEVRARREEQARAEQRQRLASLTLREREVMAMLVAGKANKMVAYLLGISTRTIEVHRARIMEKLEVGTLPELVRFALTCADAGDRRRSFA